MPDFIALKRLTASDLTFFESLFRRLKTGKQKSINLNANVLTGVFYPALDAIAASAPGGEISFPLTINGPALAPPYTLRRKIIKRAAYKNWRLNGEFVHDPPGETGRFDMLTPGDLAVLAFDGRPVPVAVQLTLLAAAAPVDAPLHAALSPLLPPDSRLSMVPLEPGDLLTALGAARALPDHALFGLVSDPAIDAALIGAAAGDPVSTRLLRRRRRRVTADDIRKAKERADANGALGEELVDAWLSWQDDVSHVWASSADALSPFDFLVSDASGQQSVDVKSTSGPFDTDFYISLAELREAALSERPYRIYRVYELTEDGAKLRISDDIRELARRLLATHNAAMFSGIRAVTFGVPPDAIRWGAEQELGTHEDEEPPHRAGQRSLFDE